MTRIYASLVLIALWCATALAKPSVAVLGVEVTGEVDQAATSTARDLTEGMRSRAKIASGPYQIAPHSSRELIDEKVLHDCDTEEPPCMAAIGKGLNADLLVYGKLAREGGGYEAILVVLDVKKRAVVRRRSIKIPPDSNGDQVRAIAKKAYADLAGEAPATGTLVVRTNVETGTLLIDDESRESFADGEAMLQLAPGRYRVAIESDGYRRREITVRVDEDDTTTETIELTQRAPGDTGAPKQGGGIGFWKPAFGVTAAATVGLAVYSLYNYIQMSNVSLVGISDTNNAAAPSVTSDRCGNRAGIVDAMGKFDEACGYYGKHKTSAYIGAGTAVLMIVSGYMAFVHTDETTDRATTATRKREIAITPHVSPDGGGAVLHLTW